MIDMSLNELLNRWQDIQAKTLQTVCLESTNDADLCSTLEQWDSSTFADFADNYGINAILVQQIQDIIDAATLTSDDVSTLVNFFNVIVAISNDAVCSQLSQSFDTDICKTFSVVPDHPDTIQEVTLDFLLNNLLEDSLPPGTTTIRDLNLPTLLRLWSFLAAMSAETLCDSIGKDITGGLPRFINMADLCSTLLEEYNGGKPVTSDVTIGEFLKGLSPEFFTDVEDAIKILTTGSGLCSVNGVEKCRCLDDKIWSGDSCVSPEECGCVHNGRYYQVCGLFYLQQSCSLGCS